MVLQGIRYGEVAGRSTTRPYETIVTGALESAWSTGGASGLIKAAAFEHFRLLQYRGVWIDWLQRYVNGRGGGVVPDELRVFTDERGWTPRLPTLDDPAAPCWSLFLFGPRIREWGFHCPERGWVHWEEFTKPGRPGEIGRGCD